MLSLRSNSTRLLLPLGYVLTRLLDASASQSPVLTVTWSWHLGISKINRMNIEAHILCSGTHRIKGTLRSFMAWRAANSPCSSHHLPASDWNLLTSSGSTVVWETDRKLCMAKKQTNKQNRNISRPNMTFHTGRYTTRKSCSIWDDDAPQIFQSVLKWLVNLSNGLRKKIQNPRWAINHFSHLKLSLDICWFLYLKFNDLLNFTLLNITFLGGVSVCCLDKSNQPRSL